MTIERRQIVEVEVEEISLVDDGAVREGFIFVKQASEETKPIVEETNPKPEEVQELDPETQEPEEIKDPQEESSSVPPEGEEKPAEEVSKAEMPTHQALVKEMLAAISEAGMQIASMATTVDFSDEEQVEMMQEKACMISDLMWKIRSSSEVMELARQTFEKASAGDAKSSLESFANMLEKFSKASVEKSSSNQEASTSLPPSMEGFSSSLMTKEKISQLVKGFVDVSQALDGVDINDLSGMLNTLMGEKQKNAQKNEVGQKEKEELEKLKADLEKERIKNAKLQEKMAKNRSVVASSQTLKSDIKTQGQTQKSQPVTWPEDLAPRQ